MGLLLWKYNFYKKVLHKKIFRFSFLCKTPHKSILLPSDTFASRNTCNKQFFFHHLIALLSLAAFVMGNWLSWQSIHSSEAWATKKKTLTKYIWSQHVQDHWWKLSSTLMSSNKGNYRVLLISCKHAELGLVYSLWWCKQMYYLCMRYLRTLQLFNKMKQEIWSDSLNSFSLHI